MVIEIHADVIRGPGSPVYLLGEEIECEITFKCELEETCILAWACAQISCQCYINESKVALPKLKVNHVDSLENSTSFVPNKGDNSLIIYTSKPKILFCDLNLDSKVNNVKKFTYKENVPYDLPPSFRGQLIKYNYKLTIGVQKLNCTTKLLRIPLRVIAIKDFHKHLSRYKSENTSAIDGDKQREENILNTKENPFLIIDKNKEENLEFILEVLQDLTSKKTPHTFNITNSLGRIVKLTLYKLDYKIGEDIVGYLDFVEAEVDCVEFVVTLHSDERLSDDCKKNAKIGNYLESHSYHKEFCLHIRNTFFTLHIPVTAAPTFSSDIVSLNWSLHFDFMISTTKPLESRISQGDEFDFVWQPNVSINTEKISWSLPINIHPNSPHLLSNINHSTDFNQLTI